MINDCFAKNKLNSKVLEVAKTISAKSNLSIKIGKKAFYKQLEMPLKKAYTYTSKMMTLNMMSMDAREGISAFLEKRKPNWKNKWQKKLRKFLKNSKTIAMVGVSSLKKKEDPKNLKRKPKFWWKKYLIFYVKF